MAYVLYKLYRLFIALEKKKIECIKHSDAQFLVLKFECFSVYTGVNSRLTKRLLVTYCCCFVLSVDLLLLLLLFLFFILYEAF